MATKSSITPSAFAARLHGGLLVLALFVATLVAFLLVQSRAQYEERAVVSGRNLSHLLTQDLDAWFDKVDLALLAVKAEAERVTASTDDALALNDFIRRQAARQPELDALRVSDAAGQLTAGTGVSADRPINIANRAFFRKLEANPSAGLVVSEPVVGQISGKWSIVFARRISGANGSFQGVAFAVVFALSDSLRSSQRWISARMG
jgi:two-component system cell cycle sensor histidine kinase/response regulator CckA